MSPAFPTSRSPLVRWTIGCVHPSGFEALRLSVWGAYRLFGPDARYVVCLNSMPMDEARSLTGALPGQVEWRPVTRDDLAPFIRPHLDAELAEGVGWKFAPFRLDRDRSELALDNDCILWALPQALRRWLDPGTTSRPVIAEDVRACFGQFAQLCGDEPRNSGIRGIPREFDLEARMREVLARRPVVMSSELDEQGLQVAAVSTHGDPDVVTVGEVTVCSPFPPHLPQLGVCGAHFVGLNARELPWSYYGRPAVDCIQEHWARHREDVVVRIAGPGANGCDTHP